MKYFNFLLAIAILFSCSDGVESDEKNQASFHEISIYEDLPAPIVKIDSIFSFENLIPLSTPDSISLSIISEIKSFGEDYLVLDKKASRLSLFNQKGEYVRSFGNIGSGPGEYLDISDFEIYDGKIVLMSRGNMSLIFYDIITGNFLNQIQIDLFGDQIVSIGNGEFLIYTNHNTRDDEAYNVLRIGINGDKIETYFPFNPDLETFVIPYSGYLMRSESEIYFSKPLHDTIYTYDEETEKFVFKYHTDLLSNYMIENQRDFSKLATPEVMVKSVRGGESFNGNFHLENENYILFSFYDHSTIKNGLLNKKDSNFIVFAKSSENPFFKIFSEAQILTKDNYVFFPIYGENVLVEDYFDHGYESNFQSDFLKSLEVIGSDFPYFICKAKITL